MIQCRDIRIAQREAEFGAGLEAVRKQHGPLGQPRLSFAYFRCQRVPAREVLGVVLAAGHLRAQSGQRYHDVVAQHQHRTDAG